MSLAQNPLARAESSIPRTARFYSSFRIESRIARNCSRVSFGLRVRPPVRLSVSEPLASDPLDRIIGTSHEDFS